MAAVPSPALDAPASTGSGAAPLEAGWGSVTQTLGFAPCLPSFPFPSLAFPFPFPFVGESAGALGVLGLVEGDSSRAAFASALSLAFTGQESAQ